MAAAKAPDDQRVTKALRNLESGRPPVVAKAAQDLMRLSPGDHRLEEVLCRRLSDPCVRVRAVVVNALGDLKDARRIQPEAGTIIVTARNLAGTAFQVKICPSYNVMGLKELLAQVVNTAPANMTLMFGSVILEDSWVLQEHGVGADAEVSFLLRSDASPKPDASIEPLVQRLEDKNEQCKLETLRALQQLAPRNSCLVGPLLQCLQREFDSGGSLQVAVEAAKFLEQLDPANAHFKEALANGFWRELRRNSQHFVRQTDPLHRIQPLSTVADILSRTAPDSTDIDELVRFFLIYQLRVLGSLPQTRNAAPRVVQELEVDDPHIKDSFLKVLQKGTHWNVLMPAMEALVQLPCDDLRMVAGLLVSRQDCSQKKTKQVRGLIAKPLDQRRGKLLEDLATEHVTDGAPDPRSSTQPVSATSGVETSPKLNSDVPDSWEDM